MKHRHRHAFTPFLGDRPQTHIHTDASQNRDFVAQPPVRVGERAGKPIRGDEPVEIRHERAAALRDDRFEPVANGKIVLQQIMQLLDGQLRRRYGAQYVQQVDVLPCGDADAIAQVKRGHPLPINRLVVGIVRHRCRPLPDVLFHVIKPGRIRRRFTHICPS